MAMMKYGTSSSSAAAPTSLNEWVQVKAASVSMEEEEERKKKAADKQAVSSK